VRHEPWPFLCRLPALSALAGAVLWWGLSNGQGRAPPRRPRGDQGLLEYERNTLEIVERYGDGVVYVSVVTRPQSVQLPPGFEFFAPFLQVPPSGARLRVRH
jgi:serine protease Do